MNNACVQSLWIGPRLSAMERLSIASFLHHGVAFDLYTYDAVAEVPAGARVLDANVILPQSRIFRYRGNGSYAGFANYFRYKLLLDRGGWWVDLDTVCLRPFDFPEDHVFASEISDGREVVANAIIGSPAGSAFAEYCWRVCESKDPATLAWGETGPRLAGEAVRALGLEAFVKSAAVFCPVPYAEWRSLLATPSIAFSSESYAVHLWHEMWRHFDQDTDAVYPAGSAYGDLQRWYLVTGV